MKMKQRAVAIIEMDELDADLQVQCVSIAARWVYFHPPRIVFEPRQRPPFLPSMDGKKELFPTE